jgi:hypothetical protein
MPYPLDALGEVSGKQLCLAPAQVGQRGIAAAVLVVGQRVVGRLAVPDDVEFHSLFLPLLENYLSSNPRTRSACLSTST